jgi:SAM-dependent methyltransferase
MNAFNRLTTSVRNHGLKGTASIAIKKAGMMASLIGDHWFDYKYGTDTIEIIELDKLDIPSENKPFGMRYEVTRARPFRKLLQTLKLPRNGVFVDLGSGKGRVLMLAAGYGFQRVIGVEFSHELNVIARNNVAAFRKKHPPEIDIEIVEGDVVDYEIQPDQTVFFMFNPFYMEVLEMVLGNIARSVARHPRKVWLIYQYPECQPTIENYGVFKQTARHEWGGCEFVIYENLA